jgi:hypothetical protein
MRIDFLDKGSADCPLIRIYGFHPDECIRLKRVFERLARGEAQEICLNDLPGVEPANGFGLIAKTGKRDRGVLYDNHNAFEWVLTPSTWDNVAGLIEPFCILGSGGYQWLEQVGEIGVLISRTGCW